MTTLECMQRAKQAATEITGVSSETKNRALLAMAECLLEAAEEILRVNAEDLRRAEGNISAVMMDRLRLTRERIEAMAQGIREVVELEDPVGRVLETVHRPGGLEIRKVTVPLGVVAIIYESRPNVTSDAASLAIKSGNACILRCGRDAHETAGVITGAMREGLRRAGLPEDAVLLVEDTDRDSAQQLMKGSGYIDLLIPRGGKGLIDRCVREATVPCIQTGTGICHIYVDRSADFAMALDILENAKTSRPSVCNAAEVCLVDRSIAAEFVPLLERRLHDGGRAVELRMDAACLAFAAEGVPAGEADFDTEFLDYVLAVAAVDGVRGAVEHIAAHSTHHSDAIVTADEAAAEIFCTAEDSAAVYVNASTRFTDGGEFGLGCEMGISTQKLHARGPMGLRELTSYKYIVRGSGNIR